MEGLILGPTVEGRGTPGPLPSQGEKLVQSHASPPLSPQPLFPQALHLQGCDLGLNPLSLKVGHEAELHGESRALAVFRPAVLKVPDQTCPRPGRPARPVRPARGTLRRWDWKGLGAPPGSVCPLLQARSAQEPTAGLKLAWLC